MCQETCPESSEGPIPSNLDLNVESQPPVIHDIVTSSPSDSEQLEATPFVTSISLGVPIDAPASILPPVVPEEPSFFPLSSKGPVAAERPVDSPSDSHSTPLGAAEAIPADTAQSGVAITAETLAAPSDADIAAAPERTEPSNLTDDHPAPETVGSEETEEEEATGENEEMELRDEMEDEEEDEDGTVSVGLSLNSNVRESCGMGFQMLLTMEHVAS